MLKKFSLIIPNYNGVNLLKSNLCYVIEACQKYTSNNNHSAEIIIIDDASTDESLPVLEQLLSSNLPNSISGSILKNKKNLGFAASVNKAVEHASAEFIILLNSDVRPDVDFLTPLLSNFNNNDVFAVGCVDKSKENGKIILRGRGVGRWEKGFLIHSAGEINDSKTTLWASGGSSAFRRDIWDKLGGFSLIYAPFYWEDVDLSYRALKSGYMVFFDKKSIVIHEHDKGAIKNNYSPFYIKTIAYKNQFIFVWKNITDLPLIISHVYWLPYHFIHATIRRDSPFFLGFFKALSHCIPVIWSRFKAQKKFILSDTEIINRVSI